MGLLCIYMIFCSYVAVDFTIMIKYTEITIYFCERVMNPGI